jgi:CRP-like cAMP-binding protein
MEMAEHTEPFYALDTAAQGEIDRITKIRKLKKGESIVGDDELMRYFYVVRSGRIKNYQLNLENGKEQTLFILRQGDMFDTIVLLDGEPHDVIYEAMEETELWQFPIERIRELIRTNESFNRVFFPYLAKQMRHVEELATDLSLYSTAERLIKLLVQNLDAKNHFKYKLIQGLSNSEIAKLIGTVRHVVERHLKALRNEGAIETKNRDIRILDTAKLLEKIDLL